MAREAGLSRTYGAVVADFAAAKRADKDLHGEYAEQLLEGPDVFARNLAGIVQSAK